MPRTSATATSSSSPLVDLTACGINDWTIHTTSTFSGVAHEILIYSGGPTTTFVAIDLDGDSHADAFIELQSATAGDVADLTDFQYFHN